MRPHLACFGPNQFHFGHAEQARTLKLVIHLMIDATGAMLSEALALGRKGRLEWAQMLEVIAASAVGSPIVKAKSQDLARRDFTATSTCERARKDFDLILGAGKASGVPLPVSAIVCQLNTACIAGGEADEGYIATVKLLARLAGLPTDRV